MNLADNYYKKKSLQVKIAVIIYTIYVMFSMKYLSVTLIKSLQKLLISS